MTVPGVLGLWDLEPSRLQGCFPDIQRAAVGCSFANCTHASEADCAVRAAVETGTLSVRRYTSYFRLREELVETGDS